MTLPFLFPADSLSGILITSGSFVSLFGGSFLTRFSVCFLANCRLLDAEFARADDPLIEIKHIAADSDTLKYMPLRYIGDGKKLNRITQTFLDLLVVTKSNSN